MQRLEAARFFGDPGVAARRVNQQSQIGGIDRLQPEKIKTLFSSMKTFNA